MIKSFETICKRSFNSETALYRLNGYGLNGYGAIAIYTQVRCNILSAVACITVRITLPYRTNMSCMHSYNFHC